MTLQSKAYEDVVSFMVNNSNPKEIIAFKASDALNERISELSAMEKANAISDIEKKELDQYMWLEHLMRLAKARARKSLKE